MSLGRRDAQRQQEFWIANDELPRSPGPYVSATEQDVEQLRAWRELNIPEFLRL